MYAKHTYPFIIVGVAFHWQFRRIKEVQTCFCSHHFNFDLQNKDSSHTSIISSKEIVKVQVSKPTAMHTIVLLNLNYSSEWNAGRLEY